MNEQSPAPARVKARPHALAEVGLVAGATLLVLALEIVLRRYELAALAPEMRSLPALLAGTALAMILAGRRGDAVAALGLARPASLLRAGLWALAILAAFILVQNLSGAVLAPAFDLPAPDLSRYAYLRGDWVAAAGAWLLLIFTAAIPEELLFRGFLLGRLAEILPGERSATVLAVLGQAAIFGAIHFQWGAGGIFATLVMGLVWGAGYVLAGRNLWTVIVAHSLAHALLVMQIASAPPV